jgi:mono/diheme cytochrome c family protein
VLVQTPEYQSLVGELEQAKKEYEANCAQTKSVEHEIEHQRAQNDLLVQEQKFTSAQLDAARYQYETELANSGRNVESRRSEYNTLAKELNELNLAIERANLSLVQMTKRTEGCAAQLKERERRERSFSGKVQILERKLAKIDPDKMSFINRIADMVRDLPILDLANPNYKINQIVLKDITDDVNFMEVPKVDRCITCHLGIDNPEYKNADQPFKTHPNLDIFLGRESPHPMEEFGCTVCHGGRGRGTDFNSSAHTPASTEQAKVWKGKYGWHPTHHWEKPMLPIQYTEASCFKCHSGQTEIKAAEKLSLGLQIIEKAGCYSCHGIEKFKGWPKPGPNLTKLASKVSKDWTYRWISDPHSFRSNTWMPSFFNQSNTNDLQSQARNQQEIHAIAEYLFKKSQEYEQGTIPAVGNSVRGEALVASVGCLACHQIDPRPNGQKVTLDSLRSEHGPSFVGIGTKTSEKWIYHWIKDPKRYHPATRMPNLRLTDQEAVDIAAYLGSLKKADFNNTSIPEINETVIDDIVLNFLVKSKTQAQAQEALKAMGLKDKMQFAGEKLIRHYGCFSCHEISGFENDKPIGTAMTEEGDKSVHKLDFGFVHLDHTNYAWFTQKLKDPRVFDQDRVKAHDEKLRMPNFHFTDGEIEAVVTALLGFVRDVPEAKIVPRETRNIDIENGQKLVRQMNCKGCHIMEGEGGSIQPSVKAWLIKYDNRSEADAEAVVTSFGPPNLIGEGKKVQAQWLFDFIHSPEIIRPWLKIRMPTFDFSAKELNILLKYFNALDGEDFPFEERIDTALTDDEFKAAQTLFSSEYFDCAKCHIVGDKLPEGSPSNWAPNFALAKTRLKPEWIVEWITDPQRLLPGTKMPNYFDPLAFDASGPDDVLNGNEHEQIRVLRNFLLTLSVPPSATPNVVSPQPLTSSTVKETLQINPVAESP